jgi:hypothetical protein
LGAALVFVACLLALTVHAAATGGIDVLTVLTVLVLGLLLMGVVSALLHPPDR